MKELRVDWTHIYRRFLTRPLGRFRRICLSKRGRAEISCQVSFVIWHQKALRYGSLTFFKQLGKISPVSELIVQVRFIVRMSEQARRLVP